VNSASIRVLVVDDNPVVRAGLEAILELDDDIEVVGTAGDGGHAIELAERLLPDLVLMDVRMPLVDGVAAAGPLSRITRVLMLSYTEDGEVIRAAIRSGAVGYLTHGSFTADELGQAIRDAVTGRASPLSPAASRAVIEAIHNGPSSPRADPAAARAGLGLSAREVDVMDLIAQGLSNGEIARALFLSEKTVKNHVNHIYAKLNVERRAAAIARWLGTTAHELERQGPW
jgi:DNA-binding NarL/FixJ family response regulator